ncbi:unnamed protein product [Ilex paraguariensis]|uniref:RRM domain-containing protein n=1 Tax=Ilex paraguariensis TaxID=185542 RepID=A0ABC8T4A5_9AQUA
MHVDEILGNQIWSFFIGRCALDSVFVFSNFHPGATVVEKSYGVVFLLCYGYCLELSFFFFLNKADSDFNDVLLQKVKVFLLSFPIQTLQIYVKVQMSYSKRSRYSCSPSPYRRFRSMSRSRSISRNRDPSVENPGNNLYVTGLSTRVTKRDVEKHFSTEGKVEDVHLVVDPWTRDSRGFGFVTMSTLKEADRCIKYLDRSVLEGRVITVEKAKRRRGRTPTPGRYLGLRTISGKISGLLVVVGPKVIFGYEDLYFSL